MKVQNDIIKYQFLLWTRNDVQTYKPDKNPQLSVHKTPKCWLGSLLIFLRETQTDDLVKDCVELWNCVVWTVVIVWVRSVSVRVLTGEWSVTGENHAMCQLFCVTDGKWIDSCSNMSFCSEWLSETWQGCCCEIVGHGNRRCLQLLWNCVIWQ